MVNHKKQFISIFNETARYHHRHKVFCDFITLASVSIHNNTLFDEKLEQEYMETVRQYEAEDTERMAMLLAEVVMGLEAESGDFLGSLYMTLELGEAARGQFFTPFCVSRMMAEMQLGDIDSLLADKPFFTVYEPACGSAGMLLAIAEVLREKGFNPTRHLWVSCTDIDPVAS
ncbi:N-6 DNA methylase, partial [Rahnella aceris]